MPPKGKKKATEEVAATPQTMDERWSVINRAIGEMNKTWGKNSDTPLIARLKDVPHDLYGVKVISSGILALDAILGPGGLPLGRTIEVFGTESSGKTTSVLTMIAQAQREGNICAFIDAEHTFDPAYAARCGVVLEDLILAQPPTGERGIDLAEGLLRAGVTVVVIDSVTALVPRAESEEEMDKQFVGTHARLMSKALRKLTPALNYDKSHRGLVIFTNQIREKVGVLYGNPETTPGGRALRFFASIRIRTKMQSDDKIMLKDEAGKDTKIQIGHTVTAELIKNKVGPPRRECQYDLIFGEGVDAIMDVCRTGLQLGVITMLGTSSYKLMHDGEELGYRGRNALIDAVRSDEALYNDLYNQVRQAIGSTKTNVPIPVDETLQEEEGDYDYVVESSDIPTTVEE